MQFFHGIINIPAIYLPHRQLSALVASKGINIADYSWLGMINCTAKYAFKSPCYVEW